jgi:hypothetical protein
MSQDSQVNKRERSRVEEDCETVMISLSHRLLRGLSWKL